MKKLLLVLVLVLGFTSCSQDEDCDLGIGQFDGKYQRVSYSVYQEDGTVNTFPQATDGSQMLVELEIKDGVWTWIYNACECPNYTIGYQEVVGDVIGNVMFKDSQVQYTLSTVNGDVINATTYDGVAFETFKRK